MMYKLTRERHVCDKGGTWLLRCKLPRQFCGRVRAKHPKTPNCPSKQFLGRNGRDFVCLWLVSFSMTFIFIFLPPDPWEDGAI